jgi:hypothetical protein
MKILRFAQDDIRAWKRTTAQTKNRKRAEQDFDRRGTYLPIIGELGRELRRSARIRARRRISLGFS